MNSLHVDSLSSSHAEASGIELGISPGLKIGKIGADYTLSELRKAYIRQLALDGVSAEIYNDIGLWKISGLENAAFSEKSEGGFNLFDAISVQSSLPAAIHLTHSNIRIRHPLFETSIPVEGAYTSEPSPALTLTIPSLALALSAYTLSAENISFKTLLKENSWEGTLDTPNVQIGGFPQDIPALKLSSHFVASAEKTTYNATLKDKAQAYAATFSVDLPYAASRQGVLTVKSLQFPYAGGVIRTSSVKIPLSGSKPVKLALTFENLSLDSLADMASDGKVKATGVISGTLPLTYYPDGKITLQEGAAQAKENGTIIVSPEAIPGGDRKELEIVRTALQNFHYTSLSLQVLSGAGNTSTIHLKVEGNNPNAFNGKPVKLNVNLSGDILPMIQQSLGALDDVKGLLEREGK
ncbi:MAG: YdbH domain-containing protein [Rickettsiales bacterium]